MTRLSRSFKKAADELHYLKYKIEFGERDDDIYIVSYPKSGTTLMQMLIYQLTTNGEINFKHIYDISPWIRNESIRRKEPGEFPSPRIIKTHDQYKEFDQETKGRFIFIFRDGMDVAVSLYNQEINYKNTEESFSEYVEKFITKKRYNWFDFTQEWFKNSKRLPILYIRYEDMLNDFEKELNRIANYLGYVVDEKNLPRIKERCSFKFMKSHEDKFGERPPEKKVYDQFIRKGKAGEGKEKFSKEEKEKFISRYRKKVGFLELKDFSYIASKP